MAFKTSGVRRRLLPVAAMLALCATSFAPVRAATPVSFVIPGNDNDGYGIGDCLRSGNTCGRVIADSWCEAHGHSKAVAFGSADDVTGAISGTDQVTKVSSGDVVIRCGE